VARHGRGVICVVVRLHGLAPLVIASTPTRKRNAFVMSDTSDEAKARAEARFNRELQRSRQDDALKAEIAAQARTVDKKTARLKELRLAKEAADREGREAGKPDGGHARKDKGKPPPPLIANPDEVKGG
jgi:hypothetical protein